MRNFQVFCGLIALIATGPSTAVPLGDRNEIPLGDLMCCLQKVSKAGATRSVQTHDIDCVLSERGTEESSGTEVQVAPLRTHAQDRAPDRLYINRVAHWSIAYPGDWIVDDHDPADLEHFFKNRILETGQRTRGRRSRSVERIYAAQHEVSCSGV